MKTGPIQPVPPHFAALCDRAIEEAAQNGEPPWLLAARRAARERLLQAGFPTLRAEDWKYTDVRPVAETRPRLPDRAAPAAPPSAPDLDDGPRLVVLNGRYEPALSRLPNDDVLEILSFDTAAHNGWAGELETLLQPAAESERASRTPFAALHTALLSGGLCVRVRAGARAARPLQICLLNSGAPEGLLVSPRIVVRVEEQAELVLIVVSGAGGAGLALTNVAYDLFVGPGARLDMVKVQADAGDAYHFSHGRCRLAEESAALLLDVSLGARLARHELAVTLEGEGAEAGLLGLCAIRGRQHADHHTLVDHRVPRGTSRQVYKGILDEAARFVFNGRIVVRPGARLTDAWQLNRNLLLSRAAVADTKPQLEISNDDVKCTHGASVGQIDRGQMFYLQSRGIPPREAEALLAHGFAEDVLLRLPHDGLRARLRGLLEDFFTAAGERPHE